MIRVPVHSPIHMRATAAPEEGNRVRLSVEIDEAEMDQALDEMMTKLSRQVRVPGFRPGKVPRRVIEARMGGASALRGEAIREALPDFYARAVSDTQLDPIDQPEIDITSGDESGPVSFEAVVLVRPSVAIPGHNGLVVTLPDLAVADDEVTAQLDRMRATSGELVERSRPARDGDQVTIDVFGTPSAGGDELRAEDLLYEVGSEGVAPGLDDQLRGARAGDILSFDSTVEGRDGPVAFRVLVKDVKELVLPEVTDEWAAEASEFSTVAELKAELDKQLRQRKIMQARIALEVKAVEALVELVTEEIPEQLVNEELRERIHDLTHRLEGQGMSLGQFLGATGRDEDAFVADLRAAALQSVKADLALRALADEEAIEVTDEELEEELAAMGTQLDLGVDQVRERLERSGRLAAVRSDRRKAKALRWLIDSIELVDESGEPVARDTLELDHGEEESE